MLLRPQPVVAHDEDDFALEPRLVRALWRMEERHFWHAARNRWIARALRRDGVLPPAPVLEVGCGSGAVACFLAGLGYAVTGIDTAELLIRKAEQRCPEVTFIHGDLRRLSSDALGPFQSVGFFDVLEHLLEPESLLRAGVRVASPGAVVIATVPALRSLHTVIDDLSGHKRRYERGELTALFERCGLERVTEQGVFRLSLPLVRRARRRVAALDLDELSPDSRRDLMLAHLRVPSTPVNAAMRALCAFERRLLFARRPRTGATILAVGRLPASG